MDLLTGKGSRHRVAAAVAVLTLLVYLPALRNGFVELDDAAYVLDNPHVRSFGHGFFRWAFLQFYAANWHPLTWISHALDCAVWGANPLGHHLTSILLHAANSGLVVLLAWRLVEVARESRQGPPGPVPSDLTAPIAAGVAGLLFGLHPVHVESAAWVAERKDLLCALFFLLSVLQYVRHASSGGATNDARVRTGLADRHYLASLGFFALALLSKPMAVTLPCVLLVLDWCPYRRIRDARTFLAALVEKLPFFGLSLASSVVTVLAQKTGEALVSAAVLPLSGRALVAGRALLAYLGKMLLPVDLAPYYPYPGLHEIAPSRPAYLVPALLAILITAASVLAARRQRAWLAAWGYYVVTLLPVLGIVQVGGQAMADRYTYLPSLGPFLLAGLGAAWAHAAAARASGSRRLANGVGMAAAAAAFLALSALTVVQIRTWKDSMSVFDAILANPARRSPMVLFHRGVAQQKAGRVGSAIEDYTEAISLFPPYHEAYFARATAYERLGRLDRALEDYGRAISLRPSSYEAYTNRGLVNERLGRRGEAIADFTRAVALSESAGKAHLNLGILHAQEGRFAEAIRELDRAIAADGTDAEAYGNRGIVRALLGQRDAALQDFDRALELQPEFPLVYYNRGRLHAASGQRERALADFQRACRLGDEISCRALRE
jgi:tetratricopeptide (TPR) repeat protein